MNSFDLDPLLLTNNDQIDEQHRELFRRVGQLLDASRERRGGGEVVSTLEYLGEYAVHHFAVEEAIMEASGYDRIESHRLEHRSFLRELEVLRLELQTEGPSHRLTIRLGNRVTTWLREHIYRTDRMLAEWLRNREGGD